jgi:hypothetical protein
LPDVYQKKPSVRGAGDDRGSQDEEDGAQKEEIGQVDECQHEEEESKAEEVIHLGIKVGDLAVSWQQYFRDHQMGSRYPRETAGRHDPGMPKPFNDLQGSGVST